jgi:hypothetical protein
MAERVDDRPRAVAIKLVLHRPLDLRLASTASLKRSSTFGTYKQIPTGVPPSDFGLRTSISGNSSASIDVRITDLDLGVANFVAMIQPHHFHCAQRLNIEINRLGRAAANQIRGDRVITIGMGLTVINASRKDKIVCSKAAAWHMV